MEMRQRQMQQFRTPQHPSMGINRWGESQQFRTPQHPSLGANHWGGEPLQFGTPQHESLGSNHWRGESRQFGTPQHESLGPNHWDGDPRQFRTPQHPSFGTGGTRQFGTPQHPGSYPEFRTPQHPSGGTNNWGGASPLLARNIAQESLDQRYERLNTIRNRDEIFAPVKGDEFLSKIEATKYECPPTPSPRGLLWKFITRKPRNQNKNATLGNSSKKKKWFPRLDGKKKWPNGWC